MIVIVVIIVVIIYFIYKIGNSKISNTKTKKTFTKNDNYISERKIEPIKENIPSVSELTKEVETISDFETFEKKQEEVYKKYSEDFGNKYYERLYRRYEDAFTKILDKMSNKVFYYQYTPYLDLFIPVKDLTIAYSYCSNEDFKIKKKGTSVEDWQEITGNDLINSGKIEDVLEKKPEYFKALFDFREVIESKLKLEEKHSNIIEIVKNNHSFRKQFFIETEDLYEKQILIWLLQDYKIPLLEKLIDLGYNTPNKLKNISVEQLQTIKGFGPSKVEQFSLSINKMNKL